MKLIFLITLVLLLIPQTQAFLEITEIMYNPEGSDNNKEYIEIYTNEDISNYIIRDFTSEDTITQLTNMQSEYILIVEEGFNYEDINATIYGVGATIGNNLNNDEDLVQIFNNSQLKDAIHYHMEQGANNNGKSLCKIECIWQECYPTPGKENNFISTQEYTIKINEFLPDPQGDDSSAMPHGEWIELFNYGNIGLDLEGAQIKDKANHILTISDTSTLESQIIGPGKYLTIYTNNKSGFLNNEGLEEITLFSIEGQIIDQITYSDSREGNSWSKIDNLWLLTKPTPGEENPLDEEEGKESNIEIEKIYLGNDNSAKFGDNIRVKVNIYKGDETKESIKAYLEKDDKKISKTTSFNIQEKYTENTLTIPIQIFPNCNLNREEGEYTLIIEGLEVKDEKKIIIEGITQNLCEKQKSSCSEENLISYIQENEFENVINNNPSSNEIVYEAQSKKNSRSGIYFFTFILVLLTIHLITEKWKK